MPTNVSPNVKKWNHKKEKGEYEERGGKERELTGSLRINPFIESMGIGQLHA
jgi:hypothetical protein